MCTFWKLTLEQQIDILQFDKIKVARVKEGRVHLVIWVPLIHNTLWKMVNSPFEENLDNYKMLSKIYKEFNQNILKRKYACIYFAFVNLLTINI